MVQPNCKVYPVAYITEKIYRKYERNIMELAKKTNAEIGFDFRQQFFNIRAQTQESVDTCVRHISGGLFPILNRALDDNMMEGTYRKLTDPEPPEPIDEQPTHGTPASRSTSVAGSVTTIVGRPPLLDGEDTNKEKSVLVGRPDYDDDGDSYDEPEEYTGVFTIAKNIKDPMEVLIGPPLPNLQPAQYLTLIGDATDTECTLEGRDVIVKGYAQNCVDDAVQRFQNIQTIYKNRKKKTIVTPCIHYPTHSPQYGLYFCDLNRYAFKDYVDLFDHMPRPLYVLLPVFRDPDTNSFKKPKDLLDAPPIPPPMSAMPPPTPQWPGRPPHLAQMSPSPNPQPQQWNTRQVSPVATTPSPLNVGFPGEAPLWGENRNFTNNRASAASYPPLSPSPSSTSTSYTSNRSSAPSPMLDDFPALPSSRAYTDAPTLGPPPRPQTRRVLRINPQKSGQGSLQPTTSMLELAKEYNLNNIKSALEEGLNRARFFKGEIRLEAKLGKVLWTKMTSEVQTRIWELLDIKDIVMKEHGIEPLFNDITTMSEALIGSISDFLPRHHSRTAYFEIHCHARTSPSIPAKPVTLVMGQGVVELQKVILHQEKITEIDWVCLDRKFDFQFSLSARELGRTDVKPYTTFIKKVSISPMTLQMTYENVPGFLEVDYIYHKQTTKYRIHFPFIVEITRVEKIPLKPQKTASYGAEKILGMTGKGQVWYEMHVYYDLHKELFKSNLNLDVGKTAHWKVDQVLGTPDQYGQPEALVSYVRCLLLLVEKCQSLRI